MSNKKFQNVKNLWPKGAPQKVVKDAPKSRTWESYVRYMYSVIEIIVYWAFNIDCILLLYLFLFKWL